MLDLIANEIWRYAMTLMNTENEIAFLRERVEGSVFTPADPGWDVARQAWNVAVDQCPSAVVLAESVDDIVAAVRFARAAGLRVAPQGTGHGAPPLGPLDDTLLVRTSLMRGVTIDPVARRARAEAGVLWEEVVNPAAQYGLSALHGSSPDVGVAGYSLGGGIGWQARLRGLAANSITALELVTADGEHVRVDADHEPELFWALRGGGGNFGVVTALEFALYPLETAYAGWLIWPWEDSARVLKRFSEWAATAPREISSSARILQLPPLDEIPEPIRGKNIIAIDGAFVGDEAAAIEILRPLRELRPAMDTFATVPAASLARLHADPEGPTPVIGDGRMLDSAPAEAIDALVAVAGPGSDSRMLIVELRQLGGALAEPAAGAGALSHLDGAFAVFAGGIPFDAETGAALHRHLGILGDVLAPWGRGRAYRNFAESHADADDWFSADAVRRLRALKAQVDPEGLFRSNHTITPAAS
jgi:FAD/FMN-containing dehydrogenase